MVVNLFYNGRRDIRDSQVALHGHDKEEYCTYQVVDGVVRVETLEQALTVGRTLRVARLQRTR